jgi:hypothetical protein
MMLLRASWRSGPVAGTEGRRRNEEQIMAKAAKKTAKAGQPPDERAADERLAAERAAAAERYKEGLAAEEEEQDRIVAMDAIRILPTLVLWALVETGRECERMTREAFGMYDFTGHESLSERLACH